MSERTDAGTGPGTPGRRGRGRRPAAEVRARVLDAAGALLLAEGLAGFTAERVAKDAGVSRTTIHKWWPSKGRLALDAYLHAVEDRLVLPDTGDIVADLTTQLRSFAALLTEGPAGRVVAELVGRARTDPALLDAFRRQYSAGRRRTAAEALRRAQQRGQIAPEADPAVLIDQMWGACYHRLLIPDEPLDGAFADALVDNLMRGIGPGDLRATPVPGR